jgi:hypothetical protein
VTVAKLVEQVEDLAPVVHGVHVTAGIAVIGLLDVADPEVGTNAVPDESFKVVERVEHHRLEFVVGRTK